MTNKKKIEIVFCSFVPVGLEDYARHFDERFGAFTYLRWRFPHSRGGAPSALIRRAADGTRTERPLRSLPATKSKLLYFALLPIHYLFLLLQAVAALWRRPGPERRLFVGVNYFCCLCGVVLRALGRVDFVLYRVMDFFPLPPSGPYRVLNRAFHAIDKLCLDKADAVWFTTEGHIAGREKYGYFDRTMKPYHMIPLGLDTRKFAPPELTPKGRRSLVYCGVVSRYHMLDLVFDALEELKKEFPDVTLNVIGSGPDLGHFKELAVRRGLGSAAVFHGFMEDGPAFAAAMADNAAGLALYRDEEDFMRYTEPAKVKHYLGFGVPAIVSDVPAIARELDSRRVGVAVRNDKAAVAAAAAIFLRGGSELEEYRRNIRDYVQSIDVNRLLDEAFNTLPDL